MSKIPSAALNGIVLCCIAILGACRHDSLLDPVVPVVSRSSSLLDADLLGLTSSTNPAQSKTLTTYAYRTAISMQLSWTISMTSDHAYGSSYVGPLDGHGILSGDCYAFVRILYGSGSYGPRPCVAWPSPPVDAVWEDSAFVIGSGSIVRVAGVPLSADESSAGGCNHGTTQCYTYTGTQSYVIGRIPAKLTLTGPAGVSPNTAVTINGAVAPQWVKNMGIPFIVQRWRWVGAGSAPDFNELAPIVNPTGCTIPQAEDTNPAVCTRTPATSGTLEIDAIVNGVPDTVRKNVGVAANARLCSSKPLNDFWYITTEFSQVDASHQKGPHAGRDYAGPGVRGVPVFAAEAGTVIYAADGGSAGNEVIVDSGGAGNSYYMHLDTIAPDLDGQQVAAGQLLGYVGDTGHSECGPENPNCDMAHLHFEQHLPGGPPYLTSGKRPHVPPPATRVEPCFF
jgi:hypothetical protein